MRLISTPSPSCSMLPARTNVRTRLSSASRPRHDSASVAWHIMCERMDDKSFARPLSLLDNIMLHQRPGQSLTEYVHIIRESLFDDYNETCDMIDCSVAIYSLNLGLLMVLGIFVTAYSATPNSVSSTPLTRITCFQRTTSWLALCICTKYGGRTPWL
jgi:hypothetical protein